MQKKFINSAANAIFFLVGPLAYFVPLSFAYLIFVILVPVILLGSPETWGRARRLALPWMPFLLIAALSAAWSLDAGASLMVSARLIGLAVGGILLIAALPTVPDPILIRLLRFLALGFCVAGFIEFTDAFDGALIGQHFHTTRTAIGYMIRYSRGAAIHSLLAIPLTIGLARAGAWRLAILQAMIAVLAIGFGYQLGAKMALLLGCIVAAALYAAPKLRWVIPALVTLSACAFPWILPLSLSPMESCWLGDHKPTALHRTIIWNFVATHIHEHPVIGWGLDASRRLPGGTDIVTVMACGAPPEAPPVISGALLPLHPHNAILQIWLELGGLGAVTAFGALVFVLIRSFGQAYTAPRIAAAMLGSMVIAIITIGSVSFGVWQEWLIGGELTAIAIVASMVQREG